MRSEKSERPAEWASRWRTDGSQGARNLLDCLLQIAAKLCMTPLHKAALILCAAVPVLSHACLWDSDTLATERARFPEVQGTMSGVFPRHSKEYHAWRVQQKAPLVESGNAKASDYDDLAVSLHKLGSHQGAIDIMLAKEKKLPGQYETYSNLGTFYIYTGDLIAAKGWIEKALSINLNAHFGREKYQLWLVQWLLEKREAAENLANPGDESIDQYHARTSGFALFVARKEMGDYRGRQDQPVSFSEDQRKAAIGGVTGMMYFADFDNPILQEALGDLLTIGSGEENAVQLAALCYLQASQRVAASEEKKRLVERALKVIQSSKGVDEAKLRAVLRKSLEQGEAYAKKVRADELAWIAAGKDVSAEFQKKYLGQKQG